MKQLILDDIYSWSVFSETRQVDFNGHLCVHAEGNVLIDPVQMIESDLNHLHELGGASVIVITNSDHEREAEQFRNRTGAEIAVHEADAAALSVKADRLLQDHEEIVTGMQVVHLQHGKSPGEIALYLPENRVVLIGDLVVGSPMGNFTLLEDSKLENASKAALELRKILSLSFDTILVGDGHSIFQGARQKLLESLERRTDVYINRINIGEIQWTRNSAPAPYDFEDKDIDSLIGAKHLGYRIIRLSPNNASFPMHLHNFAEEMFCVMNGQCTLKTPRGDVRVTEGDFIAFRPGDSGAHKFVNEGNAPCTLLAIGVVLPYDVTEYPDSDKIFPFVAKRVFRKSEHIDYWTDEV